VDRRVGRAVVGLATVLVVAKFVWVTFAPGWPAIGRAGADGEALRLFVRNTLIAVPVAVACVRRWGGRRGVANLLGSGEPTSEDAGVRWGAAVGPAALVTAVAAAASPWRDVSWPVGRLLGVLIGTALLEEVVFRGGLAALGRRSRGLRWIVPGLAFGCWHVADGWRDGAGEPLVLRLLVVAGVVAATTAASWWVLEPLRRRSGSIVGPWLLHAAVNSSLIVLGFA